MFNSLYSLLFFAFSSVSDPDPGPASEIVVYRLPESKQFKIYAISLKDLGFFGFLD
jgi:hypothetical protein